MLEQGLPDSVAAEVLGHSTPAVTRAIYQHVSRVLATGALEMCGRAEVFDLSGNLKEWTSEQRGQLGVVRGGGYETNLDAGLMCDQADDLKAPIFRHSTIGFRCCR